MLHRAVPQKRCQGGRRTKGYSHNPSEGQTLPFHQGTAHSKMAIAHFGRAGLAILGLPTL